MTLAWWTQGSTHSGIVLAVLRADTYELARRILAVLRRHGQAGWLLVEEVGHDSDPRRSDNPFARSIRS